MKKSGLQIEYETRYEKVLKPLAKKLETQLADHLANVSRIDRISSRAKSPDRFLGKASKMVDGKNKYVDPLDQIQDLVAARVTVFYLPDVDTVSDVISKFYRSVEDKTLISDSPSEFGYVGKHYILAIPEDLIDDGDDRTIIPNFFELQIKTLFQHAWSEAEHDLAYKAEEQLTILQKRKVAFTAAQSWGADETFASLHGELNSSSEAPRRERPLNGSK